MNDAVSVDAPQSHEDATPGAVLRGERERRGLTLQQAAEDLHLDPWVVEAIEANRFQALGAPVYAKGHLRKYATQLGMDANGILERYEALQDRPVISDPIPVAIATPVRAPRRSFKKPIRIVTALLVFALVSWLAWKLVPWEKFGSQGAQPQSSASTEIARSSAPAQSAQAVQQPNESATASAPDAAPPAAEAPSVTTESAVIATPAQESSPTTEAASSAEPVRLRLEFAAESWTEVYDASGARLMYGIGSPGRVRTLTGEPPLNVTLGAAAAVTAEVNGRSVTIPQRPGKDSTRFVVDANGSLR